MKSASYKAKDGIRTEWICYLLLMNQRNQVFKRKILLLGAQTRKNWLLSLEVSSYNLANRPITHLKNKE